MKDEQIFREAIVEALRKNTADLDVKVESHKSLWYRLHVGDDGQIEPTGDKPRRGYDAFEQDIVIFEKKVKEMYLALSLKPRFIGVLLMLS